MTISRMVFVGGSSARQRRQDAAKQAIPPRIVRALQRIVEYLKADEESDYHEARVGETAGHIYRDVRRLEMWLTEWVPSNGWDYPAMLPNLGEVVLMCKGSELVPHKMVEQILDMHLTHPWGTGPDTAAGEGNYHNYLGVTEHDGKFSTSHYVKNEGQPVELVVETELCVRTIVTAKATEWPKSLGADSYLYDGDGPPHKYPWGGEEE